MNTMMNIVSKARHTFVKGALLCAVLSPVAIQMVYAAEPADAATATHAVKVGDSYGGGVVAYIFKHGDAGYKANETHGLIAAKKDLSDGETWDNAKKICHEYKGGGLNDWRLPSKDELSKLYISKQQIGGFEDRHYYWSSTASDVNDAWDQSFSTGAKSLGYKSDTNLVRAVRTF
jgi:hypothetical protein